MSTKSELALDLPLVTSEHGFSAGGSIVPFRGGGFLTIDERGIVNESDKHLAALAATGRKALYAMNKTAEIQRHAVVTFAETADYIDQVKQRTKNKGYQSQVGEFADYIVNLSARQMAGDVTVAATAIAQIINS